MLFVYALTINQPDIHAEQIDSCRQQILNRYQHGGLLCLSKENQYDIDFLVESKFLKLGIGNSVVTAIADCVSGCLFTPNSDGLAEHYNNCFADVLEQKYINIQDMASGDAKPSMEDAAVVLLELLRLELIKLVYVS